MTFTITNGALNPFYTSLSSYNTRFTLTSPSAQTLAVLSPHVAGFFSLVQIEWEMHLSGCEIGRALWPFM